MIYEFGPWRIESVVVGELRVNSYIVVWTPTAEAFVIDPGDEPDRIIELLNDGKLRVRAIINTHGHGDHIGANETLKRITGAPLWIGRNDAELLADADRNMSTRFGPPIVSPPPERLLDEGDEIELGDGKLKILDVPGHSPGSIALVGDGFAIVGDALFAGSIGRTDFEEGDMQQLLDNIRGKLLTLKDDCLILPGHGPETTVGEQKLSNPFLQAGFGDVW